MTTYGVLIFDGAEELDFVGPWEVLTASAMIRSGPDGPIDSVVTIAQNGGTVRANKGMRVIADHSFDDHPQLDVVLVPGGSGTRTEVDNEMLMEWLRQVGPGCEWVTSVCTGSLLLHESGLAKGRRLCTHWGFEDAMEARGDCTVVRDERFVADGNVVSSQGVSAGIDMALWLVGQIESPEHARQVQRFIQYEPQPPYEDVPYPA